MILFYFSDEKLLRYYNFDLTSTVPGYNELVNRSRSHCRKHRNPTITSAYSISMYNHIKRSTLEIFLVMCSRVIHRFTPLSLAFISFYIWKTRWRSAIYSLDFLLIINQIIRILRPSFYAAGFFLRSYFLCLAGVKGYVRELFSTNLEHFKFTTLIMFAPVPSFHLIVTAIFLRRRENRLTGHSME